MSDAINGADPAAQHQVGIAAAQKGDVARARALLEQAVAAAPDALQYRLDLGQVQIMAGDEAAAIESFEHCLRVDPNITPAWLNLAILMLRADRIDEAGTCFERAAAGDARMVDAHAGLGVVRQRQKRMAEAAAAFEAAAKLAPGDAALLSNLAGVLHEAGRPDEAIERFEQALSLAPGEAALHTNLGVLLHEARGPEEGLPHYDAALKCVPGHARTLAAKRSALASLGRHEEARQIFDYDALISTTQFTDAPGYPDMAAFNGALAEHSVAHPTLLKAPPGKSTRGGSQTGQLRGGGPVPVLEGLIGAAVDAYFADPERQCHPFCPRRTTPGSLNIWATVLDRGGYQDPHIHPTGIVSGVYYVQMPQDGDAGAIEFGRPPAPFTLDDPEVRVIRPEPGMLVLFPSFFWHRTIPFDGPGQRISIAFDLVMDR